MPPSQSRLAEMPPASPLPASAAASAGNQLLAAITGSDAERLDLSPPRRETNVRQSLAYRIRLPLTVVCLATGVLLALRTRPPVSLQTPAGITVAAIGTVLVLFGIALRLWALVSISERKTRQLVTTGPYSLSRNPLYIGTLLIIAGFVTLWQSPILVAFLVPPVLVYVFGVVPVEERVLRGLFGVEFDAYCRHTPRWMPRLSGYVPEDRTAIWSVGVIREAQCGLWWLGLLALTLWLTDLRAAGLEMFR